MERFLSASLAVVTLALATFVAVGASNARQVGVGASPATSPSTSSFDQPKSLALLSAGPESVPPLTDVIPMPSDATLDPTTAPTDLVADPSMQRSGLDDGEWTRLYELDEKAAPDFDRGATALVVIDASPLPDPGLPADSEINACQLPVDTRPLTPLMYRAAFDEPPTDWVKLSGDWQSVDGRFYQSEAGGHDRIAQLLIDPPLHYRAGVTLVADDGLPAGGLIIGQPLPNRRNGATVVDIVQGGQSGWFLRWGRYEFDSGAYTYDGGAELGDNFDPTIAHRLTVEVRETETVVLLDRVVRASFSPIPHGRLGLVAHDTPLSFDEFVLEILHDV